MEKVKRLGVGLLPHRLAIAQTVLLLLFSFVIFTSQASAVIRLLDRSLTVYPATPGAAATYKVAFTYHTLTTVGSIDMLFCKDPIPNGPNNTHPCNPPSGLDVSHAVLSSQTANSGYVISYQDTYHIVLSRTPQAVDDTPSVYTFTNVINPTETDQSYAIRLADYASSDATGAIIDLGSILTQSNTDLTLTTQVPPILIFCIAQHVSNNCTQSDNTNYTDMGTLSATDTLTATSQMEAGTNASNGYVISVNGITMAAGTHTIDPLNIPTLSAPGNSQFGINLRQNSIPAIGNDPDEDYANAVVSPGYDSPNAYKFHDGDVVASAPNVSLIRRFTVSYIVNVPPDLRAGVYTTTLTYICSGRF